MKILLVGATGMIGSRILREAVSRGHGVRAAARHPENIPQGQGIEPVQLDANDPEAVKRLAEDVDAIVSSVSPRSGGDPIAEATSVGKALIAAAQHADVRLFVVGGAGSLMFPDGKPVMDTLPDAYRGEAMGLRAVRDSMKAADIAWTYFSPALVIAPGERTGKYRIGGTTLMTDEKGEGFISAEDFAKAVIDELETPTHIRQHFSIAY